LRNLTPFSILVRSGSNKWLFSAGNRNVL
jgi:hypothetical protein